MSAEDILTVEEVASLLKVDRRALYAAVHANQIPHRRIGKKLVRFSRRAVLNWLDATHDDSTEDAG